MKQRNADEAAVSGCSRLRFAPVQLCLQAHKALRKAQPHFPCASGALQHQFADDILPNGTKIAVQHVV